MMRTSIMIVLLVAFMAGVTGCGKKSRPTPPEGNTYPKQYPAEKER